MKPFNYASFFNFFLRSLKIQSEFLFFQVVFLIGDDYCVIFAW